MSWYGDPELYAVLGFVLSIILIVYEPVLFAIFGCLVFIGWLMVQFGVFDDEKASEPSTREPLEALQTEYATGEISETEFERRLDLIVESTEAVKRGAGSDTAGGNRAFESEADRESEYA